MFLLNHKICECCRASQGAFPCDQRNCSALAEELRKPMAGRAPSTGLPEVRARFLLRSALLSLDLKSDQFLLSGKTGWHTNGVTQKLMWTCSYFPSASACTWGRTAACLCWLVLSRERPLLEESWEDLPCFWRNTNLNLNLRTRAIFFLYNVYFLMLLINNCSAQRDSKTRPWLHRALMWACKKCPQLSDTV